MSRTYVHAKNAEAWKELLADPEKQSYLLTQVRPLRPRITSGRQRAHMPGRFLEKLEYPLIKEIPCQRKSMVLLELFDRCPRHGPDCAIGWTNLVITVEHPVALFDNGWILVRSSISAASRIGSALANLVQTSKPKTNSTLFIYHPIPYTCIRRQTIGRP